MSLNICIDCKLEKKKCKCSTLEEIKVSWWRRIFTWWWR